MRAGSRAFILIGALILGQVSSVAQGSLESAYDMVSRSGFAEAFQKVDTNTPLLAMDWFNHFHADEYCRVERSGKVSSANLAVQGGHHAQLSQTNLELLVAAINALPPPPKTIPPPERWLVVQGIRSNSWFKHTYDRADIPQAVDQLYDLTGAWLVRILPKVTGHQIARAEFGRFASLANEAHVAVSFGEEKAGSPGACSLQVWNLAAPEKIPPVLKIPYEGSPWQTSAIAPDGSILAAASPSALFAINLRTGKLVWEGAALDHQGYQGKLLAVGDKGKSLFAAGAHTIERWDLEKGRRLTHLVTNPLMAVQFLSASHDNSTVLAGYAAFNSFPTLFMIWETGKNDAALQFYEFHLSCIGISPDGHYIGMCRYGQNNLELYDWRSDQRRSVRLQLPDRDASVYGIHWSPDGKLLAANVSAFFAQSVVLYETTGWKPLAQWDCAATASSLAFTRQGTLVYFSGAELVGLDTTNLRAASN